ncbi:MAG: CDP-alcohol phosphatidyltransferase family protein [Proteobacteria bacterium]|nr:CDP-alcohol phosphatidyltransferase family protein [Pseudomonadota bacterium]
MLDTHIRPYIDPHLKRAAAWIFKRGLRADHMTWLGLAFGAFAAFFLLYQSYYVALLLIALNRMADGLDGPLARLESRNGSDAGAFLDIVFDFFIYAGLPFCMAAGIDTKTAWAATSFLLLGVTLSGVAFLAHAVIAAKRGRESTTQGQKGMYYAGGLMEGTETVIFLCLICLFPLYYVGIASVFGLLCLVTAMGRIGRALVDYA